MGMDPEVEAIKANEAKAVEQMLPDDEIPAPTSPPPASGPLLLPSERQLAAELASGNTTILEAPTTPNMGLDAEADWAEEMEVERTKRNKEDSQAAEGSAEAAPQADEEPSIKRAKGGANSEGDIGAAELTAHDLLIQVAKVQLSACQKVRAPAHH